MLKQANVSHASMNFWFFIIQLQLPVWFTEFIRRKLIIKPINSFCSNSEKLLISILHVWIDLFLRVFYDWGIILLRFLVGIFCPVTQGLVMNFKLFWLLLCYIFKVLLRSNLTTLLTHFTISFYLFII